MFCFKCGTQLPDNAQFCTSCGASQATPAASTTPVYQMNQINQQNQPNQVYQMNQVNQPNQVYQMNQPMVQALPMKWHKFLIYFSLFATAIFNLLGGIGYLTGMIYEYMEDGVTSELVYGVFGEELQYLDIAFGLITIFFAILALVARFSLASYKKDGITLLNILYGGSCVAGLLYQILALSICDIELDGTEFVSYAISFLIFSANMTYYKKREHLFH